METTIYIILAAQTLVIVGLIVVWLVHRSVVVETIRDAKEARQVEAATAAVNTDVNKALSESTKLTQEALEEAKLQEAKYMRLFETVHVVVGERDQWRELAHTARTGHAAAQDLMLREIARLCKKANEEPQKEIEDMVAEYRSTLEDRAKAVEPAPHPHEVGVDSPPTPVA